MGDSLSFCPQFSFARLSITASPADLQDLQVILNPIRASMIIYTINQSACLIAALQRYRYTSCLVSVHNLNPSRSFAHILFFLALCGLPWASAYANYLFR